MADLRPGEWLEQPDNLPSDPRELFDVFTAGHVRVLIEHERIGTLLPADTTAVADATAALLDAVRVEEISGRIMAAIMIIGCLGLTDFLQRFLPSWVDEQLQGLQRTEIGLAEAATAFLQQHHINAVADGDNPLHKILLSGAASLIFIDVVSWAKALTSENADENE